jgi:hypothetical protein
VVRRWSLLLIALVVAVWWQSVYAQAPDWRAALITLEDVPVGWSQVVSRPPSTIARGFCNAPASGLGRSGSVRADFQGSDTGPLLAHMIQVASLTEAERIVGVLSALAVPCEWEESTSDGEPLRWTARRMEFPQLGDETVALRATVTAGVLTGDAAYVFWRRGTVISAIALATLSLIPTGIELAELERLARLADQRLQAVLAAAPPAAASTPTPAPTPPSTSSPAINPARPTWIPGRP